MEGIITAIKEVNTPYAEVGDLISYTTTITNGSDQTLTQLVYHDLIDKSLEVEPGSIGINGSVSSKQVLEGLVLPDLPQHQSLSVEFNAYIRRYSNKSTSQLNESAVFTFQVNGVTESVQSASAVTTVSSVPFVPKPLNILLMQDKSLVEVGGVICFKVQITPAFCHPVSHMQFSILLDPNLCFIINSLKVNGVCQKGCSDQISLPDFKVKEQEKINPIEVQFEAMVTAYPQIIRALTSTKVGISYEFCHLAMSTESNEALVEVAPPMLWHTYQIDLPLLFEKSKCLQLQNVEIGQVTVQPMIPQHCLLDHWLSYEVLMAYVNEIGETMQYNVQKTLALQYPYTSRTKIYVWLNKQHISYEEGNIKAEIGVLLQDE